MQCLLVVSLIFVIVQTLFFDCDTLQKCIILYLFNLANFIFYTSNVLKWTICKKYRYILVRVTFNKLCHLNFFLKSTCTIFMYNTSLKINIYFLRIQWCKPIALFKMVWSWVIMTSYKWHWRYAFYKFFGCDTFQ